VTSINAWTRLVRACIRADLTVKETAVVVIRVRRGSWRAKTYREARAQAEYLRLLAEERKAS